MQECKNSLEEMNRSFKSADELNEGAFKEDTQNELLKDFGDGVREGKPEDEVHAEFIAKVDEYTGDTMVNQRNQIRSAFTKWAEDHKWDLNMNEFVSDKIPPWEKQGLSQKEYDWKRDPNAYLTNNYLSAAALAGAVFGGVFVAGAGVGKCFSDMNIL